MADALTGVGSRSIQPVELARETYWQGSAAGYLFLTPWLIGFFGLTLGPALVSLYLSFTDFNLLQPPRWIGWQNFTRMFTADARYWGAVKVTLKDDKLVFEIIEASVPALPRPEGEDEGGAGREPEAVE